MATIFLWPLDNITNMGFTVSHLIFSPTEDRTKEGTQSSLRADIKVTSADSS